MLNVTFTSEHHGAHMRAFIDATAAAFHVYPADKNMFAGKDIPNSLLADLYPYDLARLAEQLLAHVRPFMLRANRFDRLLHRSQTLRFQKAVWRLKRFLPPTHLTIREHYGQGSPQRLELGQLEQAWDKILGVEYFEDTPEPRNAWTSMGTARELFDLFEQAYMFSRVPDMYERHWEQQWQVQVTERGFQWALDEFIAAAKPLFKF